MRYFLLLTLILVTRGALGATCNAGEYLDTDGGCVPCTSGIYYCPGDDMRHDCPDINEHTRTTFPADYFDAWVKRSAFERGSTVAWKSEGYCRVYTVFENSRGEIYEYATYSTKTQKYDDTSTYAWRSVKAGYYLTSQNGCGAGAYYNLSMVCAAGGYCPGKGYTACNESNKAAVFTENFGLEVCGDNTYSNAGASGCTPCPAGTGNTGSNLSDHAGVSSCRALCGAGATKLHAGSYEFNMWSNGQCTTPALRIGLSGGTCCVNLESGSANNAINVSYGGKTYHTVN